MNASFSCSACGGGVDTGHVNELQGRDGVYESECVVGNSSGDVIVFPFAHVNVGSPREGEAGR